MTIDQNEAIWEIRRQGLHDIAYSVEQHWKRGEQVCLDNVLRLSRRVRVLVERCNRLI